jgi:serine/threonine protein kinase
MAHTPSPSQSVSHSVSRDAETLVGGSSSRVSSAASLKVTDAPPPEQPLLAPAEAPDEIGRIANFRVLKKLGEGGMGIVFLAEDNHLQRPVALKVLRPQVADEDARKRFVREARATARIKHDNVITIYQIGEDRGVPFLAMEHLQGLTLEEWLHRGKRPSFGLACRIGRETALGLAAAHERGLIHRDIKAANLWLEAPTGRVKILDFGLAKPLQTASNFTAVGMVVGTPQYMAPEQARGETVDPRADLFSLGCVLYRLCAGQLPFDGKSALSVISAVILEEPTPLPELTSGMPKSLANLVKKLLAKNPADRPPSAKAVAGLLESIDRELKANKGK